MGKGQIVSGGENGAYQVKLIYAYRNRITARLAGYTQQIALLDQRITAIDAQIAAESDPVKKAKLQDTRSVLVLQRASIQKLHDYYSTKMPADPTVAAWCADVTEDLAAGTNVGTIEIPGEPSTVLIRPAYNNRSVYTAARDGNLMPSVAGSPYQVLFNWMLLPGWQRHNPIYRSGTIVPDSIDFDQNTCSVCLDPAYSSQQSLPAVDGLTVGDCNMGDDDQSQYLTDSANDFCSRNPGHPFCTQSPGSEITLTDGMLAQLRDINLLVNGAYGRANDPSGIGVGDRWDVMSPGGSGDCEDFALTKMQMLVDTYGWNPNNLCMVTAFAKNGEYHAMLGVRTRNRGLVVLDVNYDEVMESGRVPYRIDKVALASDDWRNYARRLNNVPVEYMGCNAMAFTDSDRVVVEFTGQSWNSPKVIGFLEQPQSCSFDMVLILGNDTASSDSWSVKEYSTVYDAYNAYYDVPGDHYIYEGAEADQIWRFRMYSSEDGSNIYVFGGLNPDYNSSGGTDPGPYFPMRVYLRSDKMIVTSRSWVSLQDVPGLRHWGHGVRLNGKHHVIAGTDYRHGYGDSPSSDGNNNWFTTNFRYSSDSDSWDYQQETDVTRLMDRFFVINNTAYRLRNKTVEWLSGGDEDWSPIVYAYNGLSDAWAYKQSQIRGKVYHGSGSFGTHGYTGICFVKIGDQQIDDDPGYQVDDEGQPFLYAYKSRWIERYAAETDSWEFWMQDTNGLPSGGTYGQSGNVAGRFGFSTGYLFNDYWVAADENLGTITKKTQRYMSSDPRESLTYQTAY